jgi:hypothetical protein
MQAGGLGVGGESLHALALEKERQRLRRY